MEIMERIRAISREAAETIRPAVVEAVSAFARLAGARDKLLRHELVTPFSITLNPAWTDIGETGIMVEHAAIPGTVWCLYCDPGEMDEEGETLPGPSQWVVDVMVGGDFHHNSYHVDDNGVVWKRGSDGAIREAYRGNLSDQTGALKALLREVADTLAAVALGGDTNSSAR